MLTGWKVVLIPRELRTRLMASEVPLMYGMLTEVVGVKDWNVGAESIMRQEWRLMKWAG